jgi:hypothetical protein
MTAAPALTAAERSGQLRGRAIEVPDTDHHMVQAELRRI